MASKTSFQNIFFVICNCILYIKIIVCSRLNLKYFVGDDFLCKNIVTLTFNKQVFIRIILVVLRCIQHNKS